MSFLQPYMLFALPIIALPIVIHLIHQRRFQSVPWAAMQFLLVANRMSRGYARLRQWLILAARTLAIAGLLFAIARPLASGFLGLAAGGKVDTTLILLDRSASMSQRGPNGETKLDSALDQLVDSLNLLQSNRYVFIDSVSAKPVEFSQPEDLRKLVDGTAISATANMDEMMELAANYLRVNRPSRSEVWICSDVRQSDWQPESGRWEAVRNSILELPQMVRFHLVAYPEVNADNLTLRVTSVQRVQRQRDAELLLSLRITRQLNQSEQTKIPLQLEIDGVRSEFEIEMQGDRFDLVNYSIPINGDQERGWGRVSIPSDSYPADNEFYFVYDKSQDRQTLIVTDAPDSVAPLKLAAAVAPNPTTVCSATVVSVDQAIAAPIDQPSLIIWQARIPPEDSSLANWLNESKSPIIFLPPTEIGGEVFADVRWTRWQDKTQPIATWVGDQGLLAATQNGAALPVGKLSIKRFVAAEGKLRPLATIADGNPLLSRALANDREVYFLGTTADANDSSFATDGVVLYAMIQRAIAAGAQYMGRTRQIVAGSTPPEQTQNWKRVAGPTNSRSDLHSFAAGVYRDNELLFAVNRSEAEDQPEIVPEDQVSALFTGLSFDRVDEVTGTENSLLSEIWRLFLWLMLIALIGEALLCLPKRGRHVSNVSTPTRFESRTPESRSEFSTSTSYWTDQSSSTTTGSPPHQGATP